jgi:DNA replication protein DnaC
VLGVSKLVGDCLCIRTEREADRALRERVWREQLAAEVSSQSEVPDRFLAAAFSDMERSAGVTATLLGILQQIRVASDGVLHTEGERLADPRATVKAIARACRGISGVALIGDVGIGKTYALAALLNAARAVFVPGRMISVTALMASVRATYGSDREESEARLLERYHDAPLLVIDDLDKVYGTEWAMALLYDLVNLRYETRLPTFLTANATADKLLAGPFKRHESHGRAIVDRLVEMAPTWVALRGSSRRLGAAK